MDDISLKDCYFVKSIFLGTGMDTGFGFSRTMKPGA